MPYWEAMLTWIDLPVLSAAVALVAAGPFYGYSFLPAHPRAGTTFHPMRTHKAGTVYARHGADVGASMAFLRKCLVRNFTNCFRGNVLSCPP